MSELKKTPLFVWHEQHNAKTAPFAGFAMPIQYSGILVEHKNTRSRASVFDICHMGEFIVSGENAAGALGRVVTHNLETLAAGKCRYGFMLNPEGGVLDDLIIYRLKDQKFMLVVNGACTRSDFAWLEQNLPGNIELTDISEQTAKIDLQGPLSCNVLSRALNAGLSDLGYFNFRKLDFDGADILVSRTGYTGELGYELYVDAELALPVWEKLLEDDRVVPAGLGARDTLRLEIGLPLYGQDLDTKHTPVEAGYGALLTSKADFIGKSSLNNVREKLIALEISGRKSARHDDRVLDKNGKNVGHVTSGSFAPSLGHCIALAYVDAAFADEQEYVIKGSRWELEARSTSLPFYKDGTARLKPEC